jgi:Protein of unknown function (DUF2752)
VNLASVFTPVLAPLLKSQAFCRLVTGASIIHVGLVTLGVPSWPCPIRHGLGIPCPGCGLTRSLKALILGDWHQYIVIHAFSPLVAVVLGLMGYASIAPVAHRRWVVRHCARLEQKTGVSFWIIALFIAYWLIRFLFFREAFYHLVL